MKYWSENEKLILKQKYPHTTAYNLCKLLNRSVNAIHGKASELKIKSKMLGKTNLKYKINHNFFSKPNLLNSYWAGFIAADGCIVDATKYLRLTIQLSRKDHNLLEKLKKDLKYTGPIRKTKVNNYNISRLDIGSIKLCNDLKKNFNITPRKSLTLKPPKGLTKKQALAYVTGYLDGDGCVALQNTKPILILVGTKNFLIWCHETLFKNSSFLFKKIPLIKQKNIFRYTLYSDKANYALSKLNKNFKSTLNRKWRRLYGNS